MSGHRPTVAVMRKTYLAASETWIHSELRHARRYGRIVLTTRTENLDLFGWPDIYMPADLRRLSPAWFRDRLGRLLGGREKYFEEVCLRRGVRLLHVHFAYDAVWAMPLHRRTGLPMVVAFHGADVYNPQVVEPFADAYAELFQCAGRFIALGPRMVDRAVELGCPRDRIRVVHLSVDMDRYAFAPRAPVRDRLVLLFCARLVEVKGLRYVLDAVAMLKGRRVPVELRVIGYADPPDMDYPARVAELGIESHVRFLGRQPPDAVRQAMAEAHVFVQPSVTTRDGIIEGAHPTTLVEAQAVGCPTLATRHSDIPQVVLDGETGRLVDEKRPDQIADAVQGFYEHPDQLGEYGRRAREHVAQHFNASIEAEKLEAVYDELLKGEAHP